MRRGEAQGWREEGARVAKLWWAEEGAALLTFWGITPIQREAGNEPAKGDVNGTRTGLKTRHYKEPGV